MRRPDHATTGSPFLNRVTLRPMASTSPARSCPGMTMAGCPERRSGDAPADFEKRAPPFAGAAVVAWIRIRTSWAFGAGVATCLSWRTSELPEYEYAIAFMRASQDGWNRPLVPDRR